MQQPHFLEPLLIGASSVASLIVTVLDGTERTLATGVESAFDSRSRQRGLLGRDGLPSGQAMLIAPSSGVHTVGMRFPIDLVFAARDGRIVKLRRNVRPWRIALAVGAFAVIELAAGSIDRTGVREGDIIHVRRENAASGAV